MSYPPGAQAADATNTTVLKDTHPNRHNALANAINDIVSELGSAPKGGAADLTARLLALDSSVGGKQAASVELDAVSGLSSLGYVRRTAVGAWATAATIPWSDLTGVPSTFTPAAHASAHESGGADSVNHDSLTGFVANEHVDHSAVSISAGDGLTGGGDLTTTRTISVSFGGSGSAVTVARSDHTHTGYQAASAELDAVAGISTTGYVRRTGAGVWDTVAGVTPSAHATTHEVGGSDLVNHDSLTGFVANEHVDHSGVSVSAGTGLTGGGDLTTTRTLSVNFAGSGSADTVARSDHTHAGYQTASIELDAVAGISTTGYVKRTGAATWSTSATVPWADLTGVPSTFTPAAHAGTHANGGGDAVDHDTLTNFVANEHVDHSAVSISAGDGLTGGGNLTATRTLTVNFSGSGVATTVARSDHTHAGVYEPASAELSAIAAITTGTGYLRRTGTAAWELSTPTAAPGGADTQVQFNSSGAFGGSADFTWTADGLVVAKKVMVAATNPKTWASGYVPIEFGSRCSITMSNGTGSYYTNNGYFDGTNWRRIVASGASRFSLGDNSVVLQAAVSGTANSVITFLNVLNATTALAVFEVPTQNTAAATSTETWKVRVSGDSQNRFAVLGSGELRWGSGSAAYDASIYRSDSGELTVFSNVVLSGDLDMTGQTLTVDNIDVTNAVNPVSVKFTASASSPGATALWVNSGDSNKLYFGSSAVGGGGTPGGSTTQIQFNNSGAFGGSADFTWTAAGLAIAQRIEATSAASGNQVLTVKVSGDSQNRFQILSNNYLQWGSGSAAPDVTLWRSGGSELRVSGKFVVGTTLNIMGAGISGNGASVIFSDGLSIGDYDNITFLGRSHMVCSTVYGTKFGTSASEKLSLWGVDPVVQPSGTGETTGFTAGSGTSVNDDSTFTGNIGSTAYRINDVVKALKQLGALAA